jgi:carboxyl-terminal processing protease
MVGGAITRRMFIDKRLTGTSMAIPYCLLLQVAEEIACMLNRNRTQLVGFMKKIVIILFLVLSAATSCETQDQNMQSFETVWQTVYEKHFDPTFGGIDWRKVHDRYKPQISAAKSNSEFFSITNKMLFELNLSHLLVISPDDLKRYMPVLFAEGTIGVDIRLIDHNAVITRIKSGSPGAQAGLGLGYIILSIDGKPIEQIIKDSEAFLIPPFNSYNRLNNITNIIMGHIYGPPDTLMSIVYLDENGKTHEKTLTRKSRGQGKIISEAMPPFFIDFQVKHLENNIGYIWFNHFAEPVGVKFSTAIKSMSDSPGIIIDLRGNPGGYFKVVDAIARNLLDKKTLFYRFKMRNGTIDKILNPSQKTFNGTVVVLIDFTSTSSSELFAGSMQDIGRAIIIGVRSPGFLLVANWIKLLNGASFMYTIGQPFIPKGSVIEGKGVMPDIEVELDRTSLLQGIDSQLEEAIKYIINKTQQ